jgi:hypothetical protein
VVLRAYPPIHAPATVAGTTLAEEILQGGPQRWRKRSNCELHAHRVATDEESVDQSIDRSR